MSLRIGEAEIHDIVLRVKTILFILTQISSLEPLSHLNPDYKHLERLVLNNNSLTSLSGLETSWVHRNGPSLFDIRNNLIRKVCWEYFSTNVEFYI